MALAEIRDTRTFPTPDRSTAAAIYYDALVAALERARRAIASDDIEGRCVAVHEATEALTSLCLLLTPSRSDPLPAPLGEAFGTALNRLMRVNLQNDPEIASTVLDLVGPFVNWQLTSERRQSGPDALL